MRRLTILLAALGALLLVPAGASATSYLGHAQVTIVGSGSGEISSVGGYPIIPGFGEGNPPIACSYASPGPQTGVCENEMEDYEELGEFGVLYVSAHAAPGSAFAGWTVEEGSPEAGCTGVTPACLILAAPEFEEEAKLKAEFVAGHSLTVTKEGGNGTIISNPAGVVCGGTCSASFETGKVVTLTASPAAGYMFKSWKGCDKGGVNGRQCTVTMSAAKSVVAKFVPSYSVSVSKVGAGGLGKVSSSPGGILCLNNCSATNAEFKEGTSVAIVATPAKHFHLVKWTGDCSGNGACSFPSISANHTVGAEFKEDAQFALTVNKEGGGNGFVKASVAGISCGTTCLTTTAKYYAGTEVELTAAPGKGSALKEWIGACSGKGACKVTMSEAKTVGAKFE